MTSDWTSRMQRASLFLATGSGALLLSVLSYFWTDGWNDGVVWFVFLSWLAVLIHGLGWIILFGAILETGPEPRVEKLLSVFFASLVLFVGGLLTLPVFFPPDPSAWYFFPPWAGVLFFGVFPHVPLVFGPVVVAHGVIFLLASSDFARRGSRLSILAGGIVLFLLATTGITWQVLGLPRPFPAPVAPISLVAGLTVLGYFLIAAGFRLERSSLPAKAVPHHAV